ncbi:Nuc1p [Sugiyamaella lignohabitans]|uniref:Endonuclease n=1 Tax=Sugiyamaella lignohabitans TaxID=796027 RepID=A0A167FA38_9ASCO|nr:Nuc1p [Sugiyamaella lignohabitans]ANB15019.1 Nuc1p [Sugiyamaella lignohabitans]
MLWGKKTETTTTTNTSEVVGTIPLTPELSRAGAVVRSSLVNPAEYFQKYGFPGPVHDIASREQFISCYDRKTRNPAWVIEHITGQSLKVRDGDRGSSIFKEDTAVPALFRGQLRDYFRSGYDRGHQAPAADAKFSQNAMDETFFLTNMCPQVGDGFNRDYWAHFEHFCRKLTDSYASVRIVTGPLYLPKKDSDGKWRVSYEVIGNPPNIAVPTHFFKIIVGENPSPALGSPKGVAIGAFVLPNEKIDNNTPLKSFYVPIESVERSTGVEFLPLLPASERRDLCREVKCEITVREFVKALPAPREQLALPPPRK